MKLSIWSLVAVAVLSGTALTASAPPQAGDGRAPITAARCTALAGGMAGGLTVRELVVIASDLP
jgi:hypothetical protein